MDRLIKKYKPRYKAIIDEKFAKDGSGWLLLQQLIIAPMSLITTVLLARILSIESYGYYKYILSMYTIISIFSFSGIYNITMMNIQRGEDDFFSLGFKYKKYLRWIPSIISLFVALYYFYHHNSFLAIFFFINIFSYLIVDTYDFYLVALQGRGEFKLNATLGAFYYFVSFFPPVLIAYYTHNLYLVFITMYLCQGLFRIIGFFYVKNKIILNDSVESINFNINKIKNWRREIFSLSLNGAIGTLGVNINNIIIFNRLGAKDSALYSLALTFADFISGIIINTLTKSLLIMSRMTKEGLDDYKKKQYIKSLFSKYFIISLLSTIFCFLILPFVYKFLFNKYLFSYKYAVIYSLSLLSLTFSPALYFFTEKRMFSTINIIQIIILIVNIIFVFISTMYFGILGAIVAAVFMKFVINITYTALIYIK